MGKATKKIAYEEGFRGRPYKCSEGKLTLGYGFNLEALEMPEEVAAYWLDMLIDDIRTKLHRTPWYEHLDENRRVVLVDMAYQMGMNGVFQFRKMISALDRQDWGGAAEQLLDSKYARQTPARANRNAEILRTGEL